MGVILLNFGDEFQKDVGDGVEIEFITSLLLFLKNLFPQYLRGSVSGVKSRNEVLVLLRGRLDAIEEEGVASTALEEEPAVPGKGGIAGLKVVFFLPLLPRPDIIKVLWLTSFSVKEGVKPEKRVFQPMRKKLGEKFGVVFSLTVVVTDTELSPST